MCCGSALDSVSSEKLDKLFKLVSVYRVLTCLFYVCVCVCCMCLFIEWFSCSFVCFVFIFDFFSVCVCVAHPPHSCRKLSSLRESVTGSIPQSLSTPSQTPPSSTLTSTRPPREWARRPTGQSHRQLPALPSQPPLPPPQHPPRRAAAASTGRRPGSRRTGERWWSRKSRGPSMRVQVQRMALISAWLKMKRLKQIKPLQQHRVSMITGGLFYQA